MRLFDQESLGKTIATSLDEPGRDIVLERNVTPLDGAMLRGGWGVRDTSFTLADGTWLAVRYYPSAAPTHLVLLDAPNHSETERDGLARYLAAFSAAQVYRLRDSIPHARVRNSLGGALMDVLQARNPDAPVLMGAFSTDEGMTFSFPDGFLGTRGDVPPLSFVAARDGTPLAVREYAADTETAVIVLHGATTHDTTYAGLARYLASRNVARVFVPNLRGHGLSLHRRDSLRSLTQAQEDVADVIAHVRALYPHARVIVLGHSFGAGVTLRFATERYAEMAERYILLAPWFGLSTPIHKTRAGGTQEHMHWATGVLLTVANALGITRWNDLPLLDFEMATCLRTHIDKTRYSFAEWMAGTPAWNLSRSLRKLQRPLSVLFGGADEVFDAEKSAAMFRRVSDVQCVTIAGASHLGILFHPQAYAAIQRRIE